MKKTRACLLTLLIITLTFSNSTVSAEDLMPKPVLSTEMGVHVPEDLSNTGKAIFGEAEHVTIPKYNITLKARIDTGATTTSINAENETVIERDGKKWVKFTIGGANIELPVVRTVSIKQHGKDPLTRYCVKLTLTIGSVSEITEVTLADRSDFEFPILIGRNFLKDRAMVDVSYKFVEGLPENNNKKAVK